jgi:Holliday junction resolvase RusA-like endonuclease
MVRYGRISAVAFFKLPASWNAVTKAKMKGQPHTLRPDADNILKALGDSLFPTGDEHLFDLHIVKRWDDGNGARTVITLLPAEPPAS